MELAEGIRRWQAGAGPQQISFGTGLSRNTVRKYLAAARAMGIAKDGPPPDEEQLSLLAAIGQSGPRRVQTPRQDALEPWADQIYQWLTGDRLQMTRIHELLAVRGVLGLLPVAAALRGQAQLAQDHCGVDSGRGQDRKHEEEAMLLWGPSRWTLRNANELSGDRMALWAREAGPTL